MIQLPRLDRFDVDEYGLYPGTPATPGLHVVFKPGVTLVLGANGLGKTTLITLIYRMLTGPVDIPTLDVGGGLGSRRLDAHVLSQQDRRIFANRVNDGAQTARARLVFWLGESRIAITRSLHTLEALDVWIDSERLDATEEAFQHHVLARAHLSSFGDWILALRHLVFYFEDRRALVWDPSAQRQLLRLLFLPPDDARTWTIQERQVLELDSLVRNLQYSINKEERLVVRAKQSQGTADEVRQQLAILQRIQADEQERLESLNDQLVSVTADRQLARVRALTAEQAHESAVRAVERLQLTAVATAFPDATATARYILGQVLAEDHCLTCGRDAPDFRSLVEERLADDRCPICGSDGPIDSVDRRASSRLLSRSRHQARDTETRLSTASRERVSAEQTYDDRLNAITGLTERVARRSKEIEELIRRLPPDEQEVETHRTELATIGSRLEQRRAQLADLREQFAGFVAQVNTRIAEQKDAIKDAFETYAEGFLFEDCSLVWSPHKSRVGETGALVEFAAFELDLSGADFPSPVRRTGPSQVSESQREFIDLSFRMALMRVAAPTGSTLIIDAPESSLDAVFVTRAADVLTRFCPPGSNNRLLTTSNLIDGDLIPHLLERAGIKSPRDSRVVDLLRTAAPTAAVRALHKEYADVRRRLFSRTGRTS